MAPSCSPDPAATRGSARRLVGRYLFVAAACVCAALLLSASWLWPAAYATTWVGLAIVFTVAQSVRPWVAAALGGLTFGGALAIAFHWAPHDLGETLGLETGTACFLYALMIAWEAAPLALVAWIASRSLPSRPQRCWVVAGAWVAAEAFWPRVFPWSLAHSQTGFLPLIQLAEWGGSSLIAFCIILVTAAAASVIHQYWIRSSRGPERMAAIRCFGLVVAAIGLLTACGSGMAWLWEARARRVPSLRIALVQVDPRFTYSVGRMRERSIAAGRDVDLVCWPECALGAYRSDLSGFQDPLRTRALSQDPLVDPEFYKGMERELLAGGRSWPEGASEDGPFYQTAYLIGRDATIRGRYVKRHLMPLGEYIPGQYWFPEVGRIVDFTEIIEVGDDPSPLTLAGGSKIGVLMCYEDMIADCSRRSVDAGAEALICLANGVDFSSALPLEQHLRLALLRAVENRRAFARCTSTGISAVVSPTGEVLQRAEAGAEATLVADIPLLTGSTVYRSFGHFFPHLCLIGVGAVLLCDGWRARRAGRQRP
ncbi:MAG: apolipoprotein N-acyltransferase [Planctomycetota bacterium]